MSDQRKLRCDDATVEQILDQLDRPAGPKSGAAAAQPPKSDARTHERVTFRSRGILVVVQQPSGASVVFSAPCRNISSGGVGILVSTFVYPDAKCQVHFADARRKSRTIAGKVARCRYVEGSISVYEIGVKFDQPIDPADFTNGPRRARLLLVDANAESCQLVCEIAEALKIDFESVDGVAAAIGVAISSPFDLIVVNQDVADANGVSAVGELRRNGYTGPVLAATADASEAAAQRTAAAGFSGRLTLPFTEDALRTHLAMFSPQPAPPGDVHQFSSLVNEFAASVPQIEARVRKTGAGDDRIDVSALSERLGHEAAALSSRESTTGAEPSDNSTVQQSLAEISSQLRDLIKLCTPAEV